MKLSSNDIHRFNPQMSLRKKKEVWAKLIGKNISGAWTPTNKNAKSLETQDQEQ